jgi:GTP-binding protein HflX
MAADVLFATLDPTTRKVHMPGGRELLFTDTVGFIQKLPTQIVAAFRATLEEIAEADALLHVVDATHPNAREQIETVEDMLAELEVEHLPTVVALNKVDQLPAGLNPVEALEMEGAAVPISALTGEGLPELLAAIEAALEGTFEPVAVFLPYKRGDLLSLFHERGQVEDEQHQAEGVLIHGRLPARLLPYFGQFTQVKKES